MPLNADDQTPARDLADWSIPDYLQELIPVEPHLAVELLQLFLQDAAACLAKLEQGTEAGDAEAVAKMLHTLKGSTKQIGGLKMGAILEESEGRLETVGVNAILEELPAHRVAFQSLCAEIEKWVRRLVDDPRDYNESQPDRLQ